MTGVYQENTATLYAIVAFGILLYYLLRKRRTRYPPGPTPWPVLGNLFEIGENPAISFTRISKKYGPIFSIRIGQEAAIVLQTGQLIRDAFNEPGLQGRPDKEAVELFFTGGREGIPLGSGQSWKEKRRFAIRHLRDFGFGKSSMEEIILDEVKELISWIKSQKSKTIALHRRFSLATGNSIWRILTGERFDLNDPNLIAILDQLEETSKTIYGGKAQGLAILCFPKIAKMFPNWSGWNNLKRMLVPREKLFKKIIAEHEKTLVDEHPRDFVDCFLIETKKTTDQNSYFHPKNIGLTLQSIMSDFFTAGTDTTANSTSWSILFLIHYPDIQAKIHKEIETVIGSSRYPCIADRERMPYLEAFMMEVYRKGTTGPIGFPHCATEDVEFQGYLIPKGTSIYSNLSAVHNDVDIWGDPENFRPERFINSNGTKCDWPESLMPFSTGKRVCPGETLAKDQLFLLVSSLVQKFWIQAVPGEPLPTLAPKIGQLIIGPYHFSVVLKERL